jgi:hypothetical protein
MTSFKQYLTELNANVNYDETNGWISYREKSIGTFVHIDIFNNKIYADKHPNRQLSWTYDMAFIDNSKNGLNIYEFGFTDARGNTKATGFGKSFKYSLFAAVEKIFEKLLNELPKDSILIFKANKSERNRVEIYDRFIKKIQKHYPIILTKTEILKIIDIPFGFKPYGVCLKQETYDIVKNMKHPLNIKSIISKGEDLFSNLFQ